MFDATFLPQALDDLHWACTSPALLTTSPAVDVHLAPAGGDATLAWWEQVKRSPEPLLAALTARHPTRLGHYFETLWHYYLRHGSGRQTLAENRQVFDGTRTCGEFDWLGYSADSGLHIHQEIAVKFYLGVPGTDAGNGLHHWVGPALRDRFDLKLNKLLERQCRLADHPAAANTLKALGINQVRREILLKGYLFQPFSDPLPPTPLINPNHLTGTWMTLHQFRQQADHGHTWAYLPRLRWLSTHGATTDELLTTAAMYQHLAQVFERTQTPQMLIACAAEANNHGRHAELQRYFVTPNAWPQQAQAAVISQS